jgi:hypothetical protein
MYCVYLLNPKCWIIQRLGNPVCRAAKQLIFLTLAFDIRLFFNTPMAEWYGGAVQPGGDVDAFRNVVLVRKMVFGVQAHGVPCRTRTVKLTNVKRKQKLFRFG